MEPTKKPWNPQPAPAFWVAPSTCDIIGSDVVISEDVNPSLEKRKRRWINFEVNLVLLELLGLCSKYWWSVVSLTDPILFSNHYYIMIHYISQNISMYFYVLHSGASSFILNLFWRHLLALNFNTDFPWTILTDESSTVFRLCKKQMTAAGTKHRVFICLLKEDFSSRESPFWMWSHSCFLFCGKNNHVRCHRWNPHEIVPNENLSPPCISICQVLSILATLSRFPAVCAPWVRSVCSCPHRRELATQRWNGWKIIISPRIQG